MSQDGIEIGWIVWSAVALGLALVALREAWRDRRAVQTSKLNGARRLIVGNSMAIQGMRAAFAAVSLVAACYSFSLPNPVTYHVPAPFEVAMMAVVALGLADITLATIGDLRVWRYLNNTEVDDGKH